MSTLHRYQDKKVRITTEDGAVFTGIAELFSSGYGLHEFDREEEGIELDDVILFKSDIRNIEELTETASGAVSPRRFDTLMGALLEGPYWIVDILPEQVSAEAAGQYFAVERYFLRPERIVPLRRKYAEILLRLNCYCDMAVSFDSCASWETNPDPETFAAHVTALSGNEFLRAVFAEQNGPLRKRIPPGRVRGAERDDRLRPQRQLSDGIRSGPRAAGQDQGARRRGGAFRMESAAGRIKKA